MGHAVVRPGQMHLIEAPRRFQLLSDQESIARGRSATLGISITVHAVLVAVILVVPLFMADVLPTPGESVRAFFVAPPDVAPPPPPPPPPAPAARAVPRPATPPKVVEPDAFTAPVEVPEEIVPEEGIDLGVEGGVPGGVEGGVPGGVVGGVVGGLPDAPAPAVAPVRVGGAVKAPTRVKYVNPDYPDLARQARMQGVVILEAVIDTRGRVTDVKILRSVPLLDEAAMTAVRQWVYSPTLLNGVPTPVVMTVTVNFRLNGPPSVN